MTFNPWEVESLQAFLFLKCPECHFDTQEEVIFEDHALQNHPLAFVLFGKECKEEQFEASIGNNQEYYEHFSENYNDEILPEETPSENFILPLNSQEKTQQY